MTNHMTEKKPIPQELPPDENWTQDQIYEYMLARCRLVSENVPDDEDEICTAIIEDCMNSYISRQRLSGPKYQAYYTQDFRLKDTGYGIRNIWGYYR